MRCRNLGANDHIMIFVPHDAPLLFRERLKAQTKRLREARGWSQEDLAHKAGLHRNQIGVIEQGKRNPGLDVLEKLCRAFEVSPEELLGPTLQEASQPPAK